ncbi:CBS domain-containing protein [Rothia amarae]|uniref:CBS domain-containing protein n=1 Tax=Rothia amarae TaxID=169480 RepID=A0A7H2BMR3_9MICC|nr:CBS domain-containing protein [Rothia amarae]
MATASVITVNANSDLGHVSTLFADKHLKKAPVVDASGTVIGILNRSDINRCFVGTYLT